MTEGLGVRGLSLRSDDLASVGELYIEDDFGGWRWPSSRGQLDGLGSR
jgi:hypothetical protein